MKSRPIILTLMFWAVSLFSQDYLDVIRPFYGMRGSSGTEAGVSPIGMGVNNALLGNPALLSYSDKAFFAADLSFDQLQGTSVFNSDINHSPLELGLIFNSLSYVYPVHVYRGAWVWGINLQLVNSFNSISQFSAMDPDEGFQYQYLNRETGGLYALTAGTSVLYTMNTSIGLSISYLNGKNAFATSYSETDPDDIYTFDRYLDSLQVSPEYSGFSARLGLVSELTDVVRIGASIEFPAIISVTESSSWDELEWDDDGLEYVIEDESQTGLEYTIWGPWRLGVGLGFTMAPLELSLNYQLHSFTSSAFSGHVIDPYSGRNLELIIDEEIRDNVQNVHELSASLLVSLAPINLSLAASFKNDPLNYRLDNTIRLDTGISYDFSSGLGITLAIHNEQWRSDLNHTLLSDIERIVEVENSFTKLQFGFKYTL